MSVYGTPYQMAGLLAPRCVRCGHKADYHNTTRCRHDSGVPFGPGGVMLWDQRIYCDCSGWQRDEGWPPPHLGRDEEAEA